MLRKEILYSYGLYRKGDFPEDYELWLRLLEKGVNFFKINDYLLIGMTAKIECLETIKGTKSHHFKS